MLALSQKTTLKILDNYNIPPAARCLLLDLIARGGGETTKYDIYESGWGSLKTVHRAVLALRNAGLIVVVNPTTPGCGRRLEEWRYRLTEAAYAE